MIMSVCDIVADAAIIAGVFIAIFGVVYYIVQRKQQDFDAGKCNKGN